MTTPEQQRTHEVDEPTVREAVGAAAMGNLVEWFDYGIYSYVAVGAPAAAGVRRRYLHPAGSGRKPRDGPAQT